MIISDPAIISELRSSTFSRELKVIINGTVYDSSHVISESLVLKSSIMDESSFVLGGCVASQLTLKMIGVTPSAVLGKTIEIYVKQGCARGSVFPSDDFLPSSEAAPLGSVVTFEYQLFSGIINSAARQKNRAVFELSAYDEFYRMSCTKCRDWLKQYIFYAIDHHSDITLGDLTETALTQFDNIYSTDYADAFHNAAVYSFNKQKSLSMTRDLVDRFCDSSLSVLDILKAYCELNAQFAYIDSEGELVFKTLYKISGSVPAQYSTSQKDRDIRLLSYTDLEFEDFRTPEIKYISFPQNGGENSCDYGYSNDKSCWYISGNILTKLCTNVENLVTAFWSSGSQENFIFGDICRYRPCSVMAFGEWWLEPGDKFDLITGYSDLQYMESFIFSREIRGVSGMKVIVGAKGQSYSERKVDIVSE